MLLDFLKMSSKAAQRIAIESQLLAEEKWTIEALKKIKKQRNCLQIERLHLESKKLQLKTNKSSSNTKPDEPQTMISVPDQSSAQVTSIMDLLQILPEPGVLDEESVINEEELNLSVTTPVFSSGHTCVNMEEEEEDELDNNEDLEIDMLMLVQGAHQDMDT